MGATKPWPQVPVGNKDFTNAAVVIVGAGVSGICMAIDLIKRNNCHNFIILEKSSTVGGTWQDNKYPGCACDVWSILYSYSFDQNSDWSRLYPGQEEILDYLKNITSKYSLWKHIRFNSTVNSCRWNTETLQWETEVSVTGNKDSEFTPSYTIKSDFLISAVGQLNMPRYPSIPGLDEFKGKIIHSARWDWSYPLEDKRIAIIGNGCSAAQILPEVVKVAKKVDLYQRTPNWIVPRSDMAVPGWARAIIRYIPPIRWTLRSVMMDIRESLYTMVTDSSSADSENAREQNRKLLEEAFPGDNKIKKLLTPTYSPGCKRIIVMDDFYTSLAKDNARLEVRPIKRITETGIEVESLSDISKSLNQEGWREIGSENETQDYDLIVLATGFRTVEFLHPIEITGAQGRSLSDVWARGPQAYNGVLVEDMPNFGMFYGPNTNLGHNSIILMIEAQSRYLNTLVRSVLDANPKPIQRPGKDKLEQKRKRLALTPKKEVVDSYNDHIQSVLQKLSFADPTCSSWYKTEEGRITQNWYGTVVEYQKLLSKVVWGDLDVEGDGAEELKGRKDTVIGRVKEETQIVNVALGLATVSALAVAGCALATGRLKLPKRWRFR